MIERGAIEPLIIVGIYNTPRYKAANTHMTDETCSILLQDSDRNTGAARGA